MKTSHLGNVSEMEDIMEKEREEDDEEDQESNGKNKSLTDSENKELKDILNKVTIEETLGDGFIELNKFLQDHSRVKFYFLSRGVYQLEK